MKRLKIFLKHLQMAIKALLKGEAEEKSSPDSLEIAKKEENAEANREVPILPTTTPFSANEHGLSCPKCAHKIPISMEILLGGQVICPKCLLVLKVDKQQSAETLQALQQLKKGFDKANEMRNK